MSKSKFLFPLVTVDIALFTIDDGELKALVTQRSSAPFKGQWSLPGGVLDPVVDNSLLAAANRVMQDKVSVTLPHMEEVCSSSGPARDPRGWSISLTYLALMPMDQIHAIKGKKVDAIEWIGLEHVRHNLAFDHSMLLEKAFRKLQRKVTDHVLPLHMLPKKFTLTQLQRTIEAIAGEPVEKSAFRRRLKERHSLDLEVVQGEFERGVQRPAQLWRATAGYCFNEQTSETKIF